MVESKTNGGADAKSATPVDNLSWSKVWSETLSPGIVAECSSSDAFERRLIWGQLQSELTKELDLWDAETKTETSKPETAVSEESKIDAPEKPKAGLPIHGEGCNCKPKDEKPPVVDLDVDGVFIDAIVDVLSKSDIFTLVGIAISPGKDSIIYASPKDGSPRILIRISSTPMSATATTLNKSICPAIEKLIQRGVDAGNAEIASKIEENYNNRARANELFWRATKSLLKQVQVRGVIEYAYTWARPSETVVHICLNGQMYDLTTVILPSGLAIKGESDGKGIPKHFRGTIKIIAAVFEWAHKQTESSALDLTTKPETWPTLLSLLE
jgi:hypothetical protein